MKINKKKNVTVFALLLKNYILFTIAIVIIISFLYGLSIYVYSSEELDKTYFGTAKYLSAVETDRYDKLSVEKIAGKHGYIEIVEPSGEVIFSSKDDDKSKKYTKTELLCIRPYNAFSDVSYDKESKGKSDISVVRFIPEQKGNALIDSTMIDAGGNVLHTTQKEFPTKLTQKEMSLLTNNIKGDFEVFKYQLNTETLKRTMVIYEKMELSESAFAVIRYMAKPFLTFIIFYVLLLIIFVAWVNRKVKNPITILNEAIVGFNIGEEPVAIEYAGVDELEKICKSFNHLTEELIKKERENVKLEEGKKKLLADISHDLKTPITVIQGYAGAIKDGMVDDEQQFRYIETIYEKTKGLTDLINTFYEFSKLDHGEYKLNLKKVDVCEYARTYFASRYKELALNGYNLEVDIPESNIYLSIDNIQFSRVLDNLVSNTVKYNPRGTTIIFKMIEHKDEVEMLMGDDGVGIKKDDVKLAFEPFYVADVARNSKSGSGLGLAIVRRIVEKHNGTINLVYPPEIGYSTEFKIRLCK
ncbi:MAG: HAMP domain-containing sensor histidine kinase [Anaerovoracaceae bacterium]